MSDLDLTREEWAMVRQAGAAFTPDAQEQGINPLGEQLALDGLGPRPGELYANIHTREIACVISTVTRRKSWVQLRRAGHVFEVPFSDIGEHWLPCRPDGRLR